MITDRDVKIKKYDPRVILHSLLYDYIAKIGVGKTQLTLNDKSFSNLKTVKILIGAVGVSGCDFNFATADNVTEQPIDLGSIIPALARVIDIKTHTEVAFAHAATPIASWAVATNVATIVTASDHGLATGNSVVIAGMTETALNGTYTITRVSNTSFTFSKTHADATTTADTTGTSTFAALALAAETGSATSGAQFIASATIKALNAITAQAHTDALNNAPSAAATKVWVSATPDGKWNKITTGRLAVYVTYLEA
jgi:hypothetical protein